MTYVHWRTLDGQTHERAYPDWDTGVKVATALADTGHPGVYVTYHGPR